MRHLDLFSGIGGFALAASWVWGDDHELVAFCDNEPFCKKVLNKHWPNVPVIDDIRKIKGEDYGSVDLITGGFPCQPFSCAGKRGGADDDRYLWPEMLRVIQEIRPTWVIGENVAGIINVALDQVCSDLEDAKYTVQAFIIPACAVNAPHRRDRVWIVANNVCRRREQKRERGRLEAMGKGWSDNSMSAEKSNSDDSNSKHKGCVGWSGRGHSDVDRVQESVQARCGSWGATPRCDEISVNAPNPGNKGLQRGERPGTHAKRQAAYGPTAERNHSWDESWLEVATRFCRVDDGIPTRLDEAIRRYGYEQINIEKAVSKVVSDRKRILRYLWGQEQSAKASLRKQVCIGSYCLPDLSHQDSYERWYLGQRVKEDEELRDMWAELCSKPFEETQDLQRKMLERIGEKERHEKVASERVDRLKSLGNAIVPQVAAVIMQAIKDITEKEAA